MRKILIIDDERDLCWSISNVLEKAGDHPVCSHTGRNGLKRLKDFSPDLVILDLNLPDINGMDLLKKIKDFDQDIPVIILTGYAEIRSAVQAMKWGASDYLGKPFDNQELLLAIEKAIQEERLKREVDILRRYVARELDEKIIFGKGPVIASLLNQVKQVAPTDMTVILQGESGTGKEVLARFIHRYSHRRERPFVTVDCGAIPETLAESELFGYERGAFTGADRKKIGQFELAHEGTIFLDEIGNLPAAIQSKLLRILEEKKVQHLGGKRDIEVDVRIIVATNLDILMAVKEGRFREDLYHRLNEFTLHIPPLRERREEIPILARHFLREANNELGKNIQKFSPRVWPLLENYAWPGNIRELKNVVKRAVLLSEGLILPEHLPSGIYSPSTHAPYSGKEGTLLKRATSGTEKETISRVLQQVRGNKTQAARLLGVDRKTLYNKLKKYGLI